MPTILWLWIAYQVENKKWRYLFLAVATVNFIFNLVHHAWLQEIYSMSFLTLLFMLNPYFETWWKNRNHRNNPDSFKQFLIDTYLIAKLNKLKLFYWTSALILSITCVKYYTNYTGYILLGWLLTIFLVLYILKKIFIAIMPPEWFVHDINTGFVFLSVLIAWGVSSLITIELGTNFIIPMVFAVIFALLGFFLIHRKTRYFVPGYALILADLPWQIIRFLQSNMDYTPQVILTDLLLIVALMIGLLWLIKKPGIFPITYIALFQLFRFSAFVYQGVDHVFSYNMTVDDVTYYILYLVCWMYIVPMLFWFTAIKEQGFQGDEPQQRRSLRPNQLFEALKQKS